MLLSSSRDKRYTHPHLCKTLEALITDSFTGCQSKQLHLTHVGQKPLTGKKLYVEQYRMYVGRYSDIVQFFFWFCVLIKSLAKAGKWSRGLGRKQGSLFWLQNTEGEPLVGGWVQIHQPEVLPPYFAARKDNPGRKRQRQIYNKVKRLLTRICERETGDDERCSRSWKVETMEEVEGMVCWRGICLGYMVKSWNGGQVMKCLRVVWGQLCAGSFWPGVPQAYPCDGAFFMVWITGDHCGVV
jgi:hypothetical protein